MLGGILSAIGLLALLCGLCELVARWAADRSTARDMQRQREALYGLPPIGEPPCPWPRLEPEVEQLRRKGAL